MSDLPSASPSITAPSPAASGVPRPQGFARELLVALARMLLLLAAMLAVVVLLAWLSYDGPDGSPLQADGVCAPSRGGAACRHLSAAAGVVAFESIPSDHNGPI